jgi:hypothetical protein
LKRVKVAKDIIDSSIDKTAKAIEKISKEENRQNLMVLTINFLTLDSALRQVPTTLRLSV